MNIIDKLGILYNCLHQGESLANGQTWSNRANAGAVLVAILQGVAILSKSFGYDLHLNDVDLQTIANAVAIVGVTGVSILHTASNSQTGIKK